MGINMPSMGARTPTMRKSSVIKLKDKPPRRTGHDDLHITTSGLSRCWCLCKECFMPQGLTNMDTGKNRTPKGICICHECPCSKRYVPTITLR